MKKIFALLVMFFALTAFAVDAFGAPKKVAVYVEGDISNSDKSIR